MKEDILRLRAEGKTYKQIQDILGCSKGSLSYHLSEKGKELGKQRRIRFRRQRLTDLKIAYGGRCSRCPYDRCLDALQFHHRDATTKIGEISDMIKSASRDTLYAEAAKCDLLCANCHAEEHSPTC